MCKEATVIFRITLGSEHPHSNMTKELQHTSLINIYTYDDDFSVLYQCEFKCGHNL
jgi:hypothetical protein